MVIVVVTMTLLWLFASFFLEESEAYFLESALQNIKEEAYQVEEEIISETTLTEIVNHNPIALISKNHVLIENEDFFSKKWILDQMPERGSKATRCKDKFGDEVICAFQPLSVRDLWIFRTFEPPTLHTVLSKFTKQIWLPLLMIVLLALALAFALSRWLLHPLQRFSLAATKVATGNYESIDLPVSRTDEVGKFAKAFARMMSDLKIRERSLAETGIRLAHSERLATIGQMGAGIAHEIKNPLTSMIGYARILKSKTKEPELQEASGVIVTEAERCSQILSQILRFSRNNPEESKAYALKDVIDSSWLLLKAEAKKKSIVLLQEIEAEPLTKGSPQQLQQVILNLVINAIHASKEGGEVSLRLFEKDQKACLEIIDHGTGIPYDLQEKIFDAFFTTKDEDQGTGLGLAVASDIIRSQGGKLDLESTPGQGTKFTITLALAAT